MRKFFGYDGFLTHASGVVNTFLLTNILTLIFCIPVVTIGGALAAHQKIMQNFVMENSQPILKTYFTAFWQNLGKATVLLLLFLVTTAFLLADFYCVMLFATGVIALILYLVLIVLFALILGVTACCLSLIVRYENTLGEHLRNCLYLLMSNPGRILAMAVVAAIPGVMFLLYPATFVQIVPVWVFFGISLLVYIQAKLVKPLFDSMDAIPKLEENTLA